MNDDVIVPGVRREYGQTWHVSTTGDVNHEAIEAQLLALTRSRCNVPDDVGLSIVGWVQPPEYEGTNAYIVGVRWEQ